MFIQYRRIFPSARNSLLISILNKLLQSRHTRKNDFKHQNSTIKPFYNRNANVRYKIYYRQKKFCGANRLMMSRVEWVDGKIFFFRKYSWNCEIHALEDFKECKQSGNDKPTSLPMLPIKWLLKRFFSNCRPLRKKRKKRWKTIFIRILILLFFHTIKRLEQTVVARENEEIALKGNTQKE